MTDASAPEAPETKIGRPSDYTPELATAICLRLVDGESLRTICASPDMPDKATVFRWLARHDDFRDQYARAREAQAERLFEECLDIADDATGDWAAKQLGDEGPTVAVVDHEHISRSRLRVDTRKWMAGKLAPKKFGEKVALTGADGGAIRHEHELSDADIERRIAAVVAELAGSSGETDRAGAPAGGTEAPAGTDEAPVSLP